MLAKSLIKYPVFFLGLGMFLIFIFNEKTSIWWDKYSSRFKPNICRDAQERVTKSGPKDWEASCNQQDLIIEQVFSEENINANNQQAASYRHLANNLKQLAKISNPDTTKLLKIINFRLKLPQKTISAFISGPALIQLEKLDDEKAIAFHIHTSVKVKEETE